MLCVGPPSHVRWTRVSWVSIPVDSLVLGNPWVGFPGCPPLTDLPLPLGNGGRGHHWHTLARGQKGVGPFGFSVCLLPRHCQYDIGFGPCPFKYESERKEAPFQPDLSFYGLPAHSLSGSLKAMAKAVNIPGAARAELEGGEGGVPLKPCWGRSQCNHRAQPPTAWEPCGLCPGERVRTGVCTPVSLVRLGKQAPTLIIPPACLAPGQPMGGLPSSVCTLLCARRTSPGALARALESSLCALGLCVPGLPTLRIRGFKSNCQPGDIL